MTTKDFLYKENKMLRELLILKNEEVDSLTEEIESLKKRLENMEKDINNMCNLRMLQDRYPNNNNIGESDSTHSTLKQAFTIGEITGIDPNSAQVQMKDGVTIFATNSSDCVYGSGDECESDNISHQILTDMCMS